MAKILYATNCSAGIFHQSISWACSRMVTSKTLLDLKHVEKYNLSHALCELGHEVDILTEKNIDWKTVRSDFDKRSKILQDADIDNFFKRITSNTRFRKDFAPPNIFFMPAASKIINFNNYDMVVVDSNCEMIGATREEWYHMLQSAGVFHRDSALALKDCVEIKDIINWLDSPFQTKETENMGNRKLLYSAEILDQQIRPNLEKIDNLFYLVRAGTETAAETSSNTIVASKVMQEAINKSGKNNVEKALDMIFTPIKDSVFRYQLDEFISNDLFDKIPEIVEARKNKRIDKKTFFRKFRSGVLSCEFTEESTVKRKNILDLTKNKIFLGTELNQENFTDHIFGCLRLTRKGYKAAASYIDGLCSSS